MINKKPKFWNNKTNMIVFFLFPLTFIYKFFLILRKTFAKTIKFDVPVICVGNIYVGGTGKTPLSIFIANELKKRNKKPVIIKKFYKNHKDEHLMIKENLNDLILSDRRVNALKEAIEKGFNTVILDDGFQDHSVFKNINIICFNQKQLIGNGFVYPAGPLREDIKSLKDAHIILINGFRDQNFEQEILKINTKILFFYSKYVPKNIEIYKGKRLFAFAGIGNPENFFDLLKENDLIISEKMVFPDHHNFTQKEILKIVEIARDKNLQIVTTEKDYSRIKRFNFKEVKFIKVELNIMHENELIQKIYNFL